MKKLTLILASVFGLVSVSMAHGYGHAQINSYADAFVFDEMGVTFSVYPDGEFDFYMDGLNQSSTVSNGYVDVTFNSGYNYSPYVQYDDFGAVIQVENVPIYYDYYGRVSQVGDVLINYRNRRVCQVGGLNVFYNRHGHYAYHTGFINVWNPYFVYRPFYVAFARPAINLCFVRTNPYRQYYRPVRYAYYRPYVRNVRPCYATAGTVYRPRSGFGQVHGRYTQTANRGERPVMRERRKITTATANARPAATNRSNATTSRRNVNGYSRSTSAAKPASTRTVNRSAVNTSNSKPNASATRTSSRSTTSRAAINRKPSSTSSRSVKPQTSGRATQTRASSSNARTVKPTSTTRRSTAQKPTTSSRTSNSGTRAVKPSSNSRSSSRSRSSASKPRSTSKSTSTVNRSSSRSSGSKGESSSVKSGGKVSVGNRSSKGGR